VDEIESELHITPKNRHAYLVPSSPTPPPPSSPPQQQLQFSGTEAPFSSSKQKRGNDGDSDCEKENIQGIFHLFLIHHVVRFIM
jgi:hypothetical protein